jgi:hypothetical protein
MVGLLATVGCSAPAMTKAEMDAENVGSTSQAMYTQTDLFTKIKAAEAAMGKPAASATADVGTLDASTGDFVGRMSSYRLVNGKPVLFPAILNVVGIRAVLTWEARNRGTLPFSVTVNGVTHTAPAGATQISVDVGFASKVVWTEKVGSFSAGDTLKITRAGLNGIGAYAVPVVPLTVIYEPPQDDAKTNAAWMSDLDTSSSTVAITSTTDTSSSTTSTSTHSMIDDLVDLAPVVSAIEGIFPVASDVAGKLGSVAGAFGQAQTTYTDGTTISQDTEIDVTKSDMSSWGTYLHLGPGQGDVIGYLGNARFTWVMKDGVISQSLFDFERIGHVTVSQLGAELAALVANPAYVSPSGLDAASIRTLLALDPFVAGGPNAPLPADRFVPVTTLTLGGTTAKQYMQYSVTTSDLSTTTNYQTTVEDDSSGLLSILGIGVSTDGHEKTTVSQSTTNKLTAGKTVQAGYQLSAGSQIYSVDVYYDRLFGNYAYKRGT